MLPLSPAANLSFSFLLKSGNALLHGFHVESLPSFCSISCQSVVLCAQMYGTLPGLFDVLQCFVYFFLIGVVLLYNKPLPVPEQQA